MKLPTFLFKAFRKPRTLGEVDSLILKEADLFGTPTSDLPFISAMLDESRSRQCDKCEDGELELVTPIIQMDDKILYECKSCRERIYKKS